MPAPVTRTLLAGVASVALALRVSLAQSAGGAAAADTLATLSAGGGSTCLTTTSGAGWCWGALGITRGTPFRILSSDGRPATLRSLSPWGWSACGLTVGAEVVCDIGLTGGWVDAERNATAIPEKCRDRDCLPPLPFRGALPDGPRAVTAGPSHACALALNGAAFCWGRNAMGQLGIGTHSADSTGGDGEIVRVPTAVAGGLRFARLDAGEDLTCGVTQPDAAIYCWGYGQSGQTGDSSVMTICSGKRPFYNSTCSVATPMRVLPESLPGDFTRPAEVRFADVSAGMRLACAIDIAGAAYCWGSNYRCALGRCRSSDSPRAHRIQLPERAVEIGAGYWHACARTGAGRIFCWGNNVAGQLGSFATVNAGADGLPPNYRDTSNAAVARSTSRDDPCFSGGRCSPAPVEVSPGRHWAALAVGSDHACALAMDDGAIYCWGGTDSLALGDARPGQRCINRSEQWPDVACQATPVRIAGLPALAAPGARAPTATRERTRVLASRREVRIIFPTDTARAWGWSERNAPTYQPQYAWGVTVEGMDGTRTLVVRVGRERNEGRDFPSLDSLVQAARAERCSPGMISQCSDSGVQARVEDRRVVLTLRDSAQIARLFGMRPASVQVWTYRPEAPYEFRGDSTLVEYVEPAIPFPDAATRADAARSRRRYDESIHSNYRYISGGDDPWAPLWVVAGDSAKVRLDEMRCVHDACTSGYAALHDSGWSIADPRVARLRVVPRDTSGGVIFLGPNESRYVKGVRPGRTVLRVRGIHGASDTGASSRPPVHQLERAIIVTRPIGRVEILPRRDTVRVREIFTLRVRVTDRDGRELAGLPAKLEVLDGEDRQIRDASKPLDLAFTAAGRTRMVARLGAHADTVTMMVVAPRRP
jgi:hypothetical protein